MDIVVQASIEAAVAQAAASGLDILVNNAAVFDAAPFCEITRESYERLFAINVACTLFTLQAAARAMIASTWRSGLPAWGAGRAVERHLDGPARPPVGSGAGGRGCRYRLSGPQRAAHHAEHRGIDPAGHPNYAFYGAGSADCSLEIEVWPPLHGGGLAKSRGEAARWLIGRITMLEVTPPARALDAFPGPGPLRTHDALHLASCAYLVDHGQGIALASYDRRMTAVARAMDIPSFDSDASQTA